MLALHHPHLATSLSAPMAARTAALARVAASAAVPALGAALQTRSMAMFRARRSWAPPSAASSPLPSSWSHCPRAATATPWTAITPLSELASPVTVSAVALTPHWRAFSTSILRAAAEHESTKPTTTATPASGAPPPTGDSSSNVPTTQTAETAVVPPPKKPFMRKWREDTWPHIKEEVAHYKEGSKLLAYEVKLSSRYLLKLMRGNKLSRREHRQLKRTVSDLFRLVPFAILVAIPFAELALPLLLKLFPNMLPSTFEKSFDKEEKKKKMLKMRLELAKFLQETVDEMAVTSADKQNATAALEFSGFFRKIRTTGEPPETAELIRVAQQFENELTLENLSRPQLVSMCKYMGINAFGTDNFLRFQVRNKMRQLHTDDQMIFFEGVDSLSVYELQRACAERGIKTIGVSPARLRHDLQQWLDLHLIHKIPSSLLILSRAFIISDQPMLDTRRAALAGEPVDELPKTTAEALQATLQSLPPNLINEAELKLADQEGKASFKKKLEALKQQEEIIAEELEQEAQAAEEAKLRKQQEEAKKKKLDEEAAAALAASAAPAPAEPSPATAALAADAAAPAAPTVATTPETPVAAAPTPATPVSVAEAAAAAAVATAEPDVTMSPEQVKELGEAIKVLVAKSAVDTERVELESLKGGRAEKEKEKEAKEAKVAEPAAVPVEPTAPTPSGPPAVAPAATPEPVMPEPSAPAAPPVVTEPAKDQVAAPDAASAAAAAKASKATTRLDSQVEKLLNKISSELEQYELEMATDPKLPLIQANERGQITVQDLETALRVIRSRPNDDAEIKAIVRKLDVDGDGLVALHELMELARSFEEVEGHGVVVQAASSSSSSSSAAKPTATSDEASKDAAGPADKKQ